MTPYAYRAAYGLAVLLNLGLGAFLALLAAGKVPLPEGWVWATPIVIAVVTGACALLPRIGSEPLAAQVDALKTRGVPKHEMVVLSQEEAISGLANPASPDMVKAVADELEARMRRTPAERT